MGKVAIPDEVLRKPGPLDSDAASCDGLQGEQIRLEARIVAVADIYDALTQVRVYKPALDPAEAEKILQGMAAAGRLDRRCVQALLEAREQRLAIAAAYVDS